MAKKEGRDDPFAHVDALCLHHLGEGFSGKTAPQMGELYKRALWIEQRKIDIVAVGVAKAFTPIEGTK